MLLTRRLALKHGMLLGVAREVGECEEEVVREEEKGVDRHVAPAILGRSSPPCRTCHFRELLVRIDVITLPYTYRVTAV